MSSLCHPLTSCVTFVPVAPLRLSNPKSVTPRRVRLTPIRRRVHRNQPTMVLSPIVLLRALICPAAFAVTLIFHARNPARLPALLPPLWPVAADFSLRLKHRVVPVSLLASFRLGRLVQRMQTTSADKLSDEDLVSEARPLLDGDINSAEELEDLEAQLEQLEKGATILSRIRGALSLVNVIWLVSIIGLGVTLRPTLVLLGGKFIEVVSQWFIHHVLPILVRLHRVGVFEALCYMGCSLIVAQAGRYLSTMGVGSPGSYVALTAFAAAMLTFQYTMHLHVDRHLFPPTTTEEMAEAGIRLSSVLWGGFQLAVLAPLAMVHESELLGFCSIWSLLSILGYFAGTTPMGYVIGFSSEDSMGRTAICCALLVSGFVSARLLGWTKFVSLKPFHLGVMVMGNLGYFLALLIRSSKYYSEGSIFVVAQIHMVVSLAVALGVGRVFGIEAMNNTASTFGALFVVEKFSDLDWDNWTVVGWFGAFGLLYAVAAFLRTHPRYLRSLLDGRGLLSSDD